VSDRALLERAIRNTTASERYPEGSARSFAREVIRVNERTVRRWLEGTSTIRDQTLRERIEQLASRRPPARN